MKSIIAGSLHESENASNVLSRKAVVVLDHCDRVSIAVQMLGCKQYEGKCKEPIMLKILSP